MNSSERNSTHCVHVTISAHIAFMVVYSLLFLVGLVLNGFTLKVYFFGPPQRTSSSVTVYLKNLAVADFLMSLCLPLRIMNHASAAVPIRQAYCSFGGSAFYLNMYASILFMGYIAANRYLKIVHPRGTSFLQRVRFARIISSFTWIILLATMSTYIVLSLLTQDPVVSLPFTVTCEVLQSQQLNLFYKIIHGCAAAIFLAVLFFLVSFYSSISYRLSQVQRQLTSSSPIKLTKSRRNMLVLVSVFCVCFVPYHLVRLPYAFLSRWCSLSQVFYYLKELTVMVSVFNVCLDPLIYFIFCKAFRAQLRMRKTFSSTGHGTAGMSGNEEK